MARKRILSMLIALVMCMGILPKSPVVPEVSALAAPGIAERSIGEEPSSDSFVAGKMDNQWTILRPVTTGPLAYEIEKGLGLKLKTQDSGMQTSQTSTPENVFTRPGDADQWEAVAKVYFPTAPNQNYQQIAFGVIDDDYNYVKLDIEFNTTTRRVQFSINRDGVYSHTHWTNLNNAIFPAEANANRATDLVAYYKIVKNNNTYKAYVSFDGETYYTVGSRSGSFGGSNTNGEYTAEYKNPKIYVSAIKDYDSRSAVIDTYCEFVKIYNINGGPTINVLESAFDDVVDYVNNDDNEAIKNIPDTVNLLVGNTYSAMAFEGLPKVPYGYNYKLSPGSSSVLSVNNTTGTATANEPGSTTLKLELVQGTRTQLIKTVNVNVSDKTDSVTVQFDYNYTGSPARPDSFTRQTDGNGKLESFPVEQTLPQAGSRADYGFVGWYTNPEGTGEKVTLDTVFTEDTMLYAKWEQVPSLYKEYEDYFLMGAFQDYNSTNNYQWNKHYNVMCPSNNFKLTNQIDTAAMRNNFTEARNKILADTTMTDKEKEEALKRANEEIVLQANPRVMTQLNNIRAWNEAHPDDKKYTRFHVVAWHGGQQPNVFFTNGYQYTNDATSLSKSQNLFDTNQDGAFASRETMKARLDNYIKLLMEKYEPYKDIIISWDIVNEPVDDFTGQIRNGSDSSSQRGQWGLIWHDMNPARNLDGSLKFTTAPDPMGVINDIGRLYDESEWVRWAFESSAKWTKANNCDWGLYVNDYMDSNKLYTKLQPTLDIMQWIRDDVDMKGIKLGWGMQGRLAWAYPTIDMLRKQVEDGLEICDEMAVTEADIRSDFEPNPFFDPTKPTRPVQETDTPQWNANDLSSGSGSFSNPSPSTLMNCFDTHNSPVRRIPEWGTGNGMTAGSDRYNAANYLAISEEIMKKQADFAADWMDILIENADKVEVFQWDGYSDSNTFNNSKGCHLWVNSGITGRSGTFEKYSFFAVIGAPARDKLNKAIIACPALTDADKFAGASEAWAEYVKALDTAKALVDKRIYTLEGVNDVKDATKALYDAAAVLEKTCTILTYNANGGSGDIVKDGYTPGANSVVKTDAAVGFSKPGYTFIGWNTSANGGGTSYTSGSTIKMDKNVMLYAQWKAEPKACTVAFESYGGTEVASVSVMEGEKVSKPANPSKIGFSFDGWYRDMALTNKWDFANGIVTANMRLYAKWSDSSSVSRFDAYINDSGKITVEYLNADTSPVSGTFFVAVYNEGVLVCVKEQQLSAPASSVDKKTFDDINLSDYTGSQYHVKAFAWGSNYVPLDSAIVIK